MDALLKKLQTVETQFGQTQKVAEKFAAATKGVGDAAEKAGKGAANGSKGFGQFAMSLGRIFKYRMIRKVIREIASALKEGLENAYQFSKGIGGELAAAMDTLSTKSLTMKNQLGSAFGEVLMHIMPILLRLIEIVRTAANAIAQFFAALRGSSTYLKAVDASGAMADNLASGAGSAKELRRQLMGFDEINRLDNPNSGSGGGGGASGIDYSKMFEESPVPEWLQDLGQRLNELLPILTKIAAIIGGISLLRHIGEVLGWGAAFKDATGKVMGLAVAVGGLVLLWDGFKDAANNGVNWGNLMEMLGGTTALVIGLAMAFGSVGAAIGLLIGGVALCVVGFSDWIKTGEATTPVLTAISVGILAIGAAITLMVGGWIPAVIAAVAAAAVWIIGKWDDIKIAWNNFWDSLFYRVATWANGVLDYLYPVLSFIDQIVAFMGGSSNLSGFRFNTGGYEKNPNFSSAGKFASGGFPEDGLFFANHNELVGQFSNGQTAVANNAQIIEGIKQGVMAGMSAANNGRSNEVKVYLDGKQLSNAVTRNQRMTERSTGVALA